MAATPLPWHDFVIPAGALLLFGGFGFGLLTFLMLVRRSRRQEKVLALAHPGEPWLWKKDWASGRIRSSAASLAGALLFAAFWNTFCIVIWLAFLSAGKVSRTDEQVFWWFMTPFTIVGLGMIVWAGVSLMRWRKFGRSVFQMASVPGVIGGQLAGVIRTPVKIEPADCFRIKLSCIHCVTPRASRGQVSRNIIWQDEQVVTRDLLQRDVAHSAIPVLFQIPYQCRQIDDGEPNSAILWRLEVLAKMPGVDYGAEFDVPVFKTPQSDPHFVVDRNLVGEYSAPETPEHDLHDAGVAGMASPSGDGWRFVFPMARHPGIAAFFTVPALVFTGAPLLWACLDFELIAIPFFMVFGLCAVCLWIAAVDLWFYRSVIDASPRGLTVVGGLFGWSRRRWIETADVVQIATVSRVQSDKEMYYNLVIVCRDGKRVTAAKRLPGHRLAVPLVRQIDQAMGRQETPGGG